MKTLKFSYDSDKFDKEEFFGNKRSKQFHEHINFTLVKLLPSLHYTLALL